MKFNRTISSGGDGTFLKLEEGKPVVGCIRGDVKDLFVVWQNKKPEYVDEGTEGAKFRFRVNIAVKVDGGFDMKILEGGAQIYGQLKDLEEDYDLESYFIKIKRTGSGMDTEYSVLPMPKGDVTKEDMKIIEKIKMHDLSPKTKQDDDQIPF